MFKEIARWLAEIQINDGDEIKFVIRRVFSYLNNSKTVEASHVFMSYSSNILFIK